MKFVISIDNEASKIKNQPTSPPQYPKIYSQDLINNLFKHPYTKIDFVVTDLNVTRQTASKHLAHFVDLGILTLHKIGKENFYVNNDLLDIPEHTDPPKIHRHPFCISCTSYLIGESMIFHTFDECAF